MQYQEVRRLVLAVCVGARARYLTHLLTYLYKQASSVSSIRVSVMAVCVSRARKH